MHEQFLQAIIAAKADRPHTIDQARDMFLAPIAAARGRRVRERLTRGYNNFARRARRTARRWFGAPLLRRPGYLLRNRTLDGALYAASLSNLVYMTDRMAQRAAIEALLVQLERGPFRDSLTARADATEYLIALLQNAYPNDLYRLRGTALVAGAIGAQMGAQHNLLMHGNIGVQIQPRHRLLPHDAEIEEVIRRTWTSLPPAHVVIVLEQAPATEKLVSVDLATDPPTIYMYARSTKGLDVVAALRENRSYDIDGLRNAIYQVVQLVIMHTASRKRSSEEDEPPGKRRMGDSDGDSDSDRDDATSDNEGSDDYGQISFLQIYVPPSTADMIRIVGPNPGASVDAPTISAKNKSRISTGLPNKFSLSLAPIGHAKHLGSSKPSVPFVNMRFGDLSLPNYQLDDTKPPLFSLHQLRDHLHAVAKHAGDENLVARGRKWFKAYEKRKVLHDEVKDEHYDAWELTLPRGWRFGLSPYTVLRAVPVDEDDYEPHPFNTKDDSFEAAINAAQLHTFPNQEDGDFYDSGDDHDSDAGSFDQGDDDGDQSGWPVEMVRKEVHAYLAKQWDAVSARVAASKASIGLPPSAASAVVPAHVHQPKPPRAATPPPQSAVPAAAAKQGLPSFVQETIRDSELGVVDRIVKLRTGATRGLPITFVMRSGPIPPDTTRQYLSSDPKYAANIRAAGLAMTMGGAAHRKLMGVPSELYNFAMDPPVVLFESQVVPYYETATARAATGAPDAMPSVSAPPAAAAAASSSSTKKTKKTAASSDGTKKPRDRHAKWWTPYATASAGGLSAVVKLPAGKRYGLPAKFTLRYGVPPADTTYERNTPRTYATNDPVFKEIVKQAQLTRLDEGYNRDYFADFPADEAGFEPNPPTTFYVAQFDRYMSTMYKRYRGGRASVQSSNSSSGTLSSSSSSSVSSLYYYSD